MRGCRSIGARWWANDRPQADSEIVLVFLRDSVSTATAQCGHLLAMARIPSGAYCVPSYLLK